MRLKNTPIALLSTLSYAFSMSSYIRYVVRRLNLAKSTMGITVIKAVVTFLPGQKPCWSLLYNSPSIGYNRLVKIFITSRYQIEVTLIGRRLEGLSVGRSRLGIAVSRVWRSSGSTPVSSKDYKHSVMRSVTPGISHNTLSTSALIPYAPTAV